MAHFKVGNIEHAKALVKEAQTLAGDKPPTPTKALIDEAIRVWVQETSKR